MLIEFFELKYTSFRCLQVFYATEYIFSSDSTEHPPSSKKLTQFVSSCNKRQSLRTTHSLEGQDGPCDGHARSMDTVPMSP